jgi:CDP-glycerol glycerophosphotransferase (TagB/SpsB family)
VKKRGPGNSVFFLEKSKCQASPWRLTLTRLPDDVCEQVQVTSTLVPIWQIRGITQNNLVVVTHLFHLNPLACYFIIQKELKI